MFSIYIISLKQKKRLWLLVEAVVFLQVELVQEILFDVQGIWKRFRTQCGAQSPESSLGFKDKPLADNICRC